MPSANAARATVPGSIDPAGARATTWPSGQAKVYGRTTPPESDAPLAAGSVDDGGRGSTAAASPVDQQPAEPKSVERKPVDQQSADRKPVSWMSVGERPGGPGKSAATSAPVKFSAEPASPDPGLPEPSTPEPGRPAPVKPEPTRPEPAPLPTPYPAPTPPGPGPSPVPPGPGPYPVPPGPGPSPVPPGPGPSPVPAPFPAPPVLSGHAPGAVPSYSMPSGVKPSGGQYGTPAASSGLSASGGARQPFGGPAAQVSTPPARPVTYGSGTSASGSGQSTAVPQQRGPGTVYGGLADYAPTDMTMPVTINPVENSGSLTGHILAQGWRDGPDNQRRSNVKVVVAMLLVLVALVGVSVLFLFTVGDAFSDMIGGVFKQ